MTPYEKRHAVVHRIADAHGVNPAAIYGWSKFQEVVRARDAAIRALAAECGMGQSEIARFLGLVPSSVWAAFNRDKKRRRNTEWSRQARARNMAARA
jgi:lambda repressor-like predicted transcriptional regulator